MADFTRNRDSKGRFISYKSQQEDVRKTVSAISKQLESYSAEHRDEPETIEQEWSKPDYPEKPSWMDLTKGRPMYKHSNGEYYYYPERKEAFNYEQEFRYSERAEQKFGWDEQRQFEMYSILKQANERLLEMEQESGIRFGEFFYYDLETNADRIRRRLLRAERVLGEDYFNDLASEYKRDLVEELRKFAFENGIKDLSNELEKMDAKHLFMFLQANNLTSMAYSLESQLDFSSLEDVELSIKALVTSAKEFIETLD